MRLTARLEYCVIQERRSFQSPVLVGRGRDIAAGLAEYALCTVPVASRHDSLNNQSLVGVVVEGPFSALASDWGYPSIRMLGCRLLFLFDAAERLGQVAAHGLWRPPGDRMCLTDLDRL